MPIISIHALRVEGDRFCSSAPRPGPIFLSTPSGWRATEKVNFGRLVKAISIHALRVEGDTTPLGLSIATLYISIHALRVEGDLFVLSNSICYNISIHALRVEGDFHLFYSVHIVFGISIHALRVEGDAPRRGCVVRFLYFYPRPPGGGRRNTGMVDKQSLTISIHALRVEGDCDKSVDYQYPLNFYPRPPGGGRLDQMFNTYTSSTFLSTPSGWRATKMGHIYIRIAQISIHALRVEGDPCFAA